MDITVILWDIQKLRGLRSTLILNQMMITVHALSVNVLIAINISENSFLAFQYHHNDI